MKRSEINRIIRDAAAFIRQQNFALPPFAHWSPQDWKRKGSDCRHIVEQNLGWDVTDLGSGDFRKVGLVLFTLRNGAAADRNDPTASGKTYAEKVMVSQENQVTPTHYHWKKMEDIINRGGGELVCQLWHEDAQAQPDASRPVTVLCDGIERSIPGGGTITLAPGESVTLPTRLFHKFWGAPGKGPVLLGEVSKVNDDHTDNYFPGSPPRFPSIEEDEAPAYLMVGDYRSYYRG